MKFRIVKETTRTELFTVEAASIEEANDNVDSWEFDETEKDVHMSSTVGVSEFVEPKPLDK